NGAYLSNVAPCWWVVPVNDINGQSPGEGAGAKMIFSLRGARFTKVKADGTTETGTFSFNMNSRTITKTGDVWGKGKLTLKGTTVLNGVSPNEGGAKVYEYDILMLDDNSMALAYAAAGAKEADSEAWFWMFRAAD